MNRPKKRVRTGSLDDATPAPIRGFAQRKLAEKFGTMPNSDFDDIAAGIEAMRGEQIKATAAGLTQTQRHIRTIAENVEPGSKFVERTRGERSTKTRARRPAVAKGVQAAAAEMPLDLVDAYAGRLSEQRDAGAVLWFRADAFRLRLADNTYLVPEYVVMVASGEIEMHILRLHWSADCRARVKQAAMQFPIRFRAVSRDNAGAWTVEEVTKTEEAVA